MSEWISVSTPPPIYPEDYIHTSGPVLGVCQWGHISVVVLEKYDDDDDATWYTTDSEHWNLGNSITHWMPLPKLPKLPERS